MSNIATFSPIAKKNNVFWERSGKVFRDAGMASFMVATVLGTTGSVTPTVDTTTSIKPIKITSGIGTSRQSRSLKSQKNVNQVDLKVFNPFINEYDKTNQAIAILTNGKTLEGVTTLIYKPSLSSDGEKLLSGNLQYIGKIPPKVKPVDQLLKYDTTGTESQEFKLITGSLNFIGKIPKKPRV